MRKIEPYVIRVHHALQPVASTTVSTFSAHVIPAWNNRVVPQYYTYVAPHVRSALSYLDPYLAVVRTGYGRYLVPYLRTGAATAWKLQEQAQPYVIFAWCKSVDGYRFAKPYARPAWERSKDAVIRTLAYLAVYRRQFVDPHVAQMWAKIKELSGDKVVPTTTRPAVTPKPIPVADTPVGEESSTVASISVGEDTHSPVPVSTPIPPPVLSNGGGQSSGGPHVTTVTPGAVNILGDGPTDPVGIPVPEEPEVAPPHEEELHASVVAAPTEQKPAPAISPIDETPTPTPTHAPKQAMPVAPEDEDEDELDLFSAEIGLDLDESEDAVEEEDPFTPPPEESDEEREARLKAKAEETAWKRKEITDRHTNWEYQLEDLKREQMEIFRLALLNIRKGSAKGLKQGSDIQRAINEFAADGDKYLRGAESYLKNLVKEKKKQDKSALWERVVQKVKDKFEKKLDEVDRMVGDWYNGIAASEGKMVEKVTKTVAELVEKAQADIGLDYSWLDDVTTDDWVRYHDLMRCELISFHHPIFEFLTISLTHIASYTASDSFHEEILMQRNGTHEEALENPILQVLRELRVEVDDIITGFESRLRRIQRDGERTFGGANQDDENSSDAKSAEDPSVSILPVVNEESVPQVIIGKSSEQVMEALKEAPLEDLVASEQKESDEAHTHEEL